MRRTPSGAPDNGNLRVYERKSAARSSPKQLPALHPCVVRGESLMSTAFHARYFAMN